MSSTSNYLGGHEDLFHRFREAVEKGQGQAGVALQIGIASEVNQRAVPTYLERISKLLERCDPIRALGGFHFLDGVLRANTPGSVAFGMDSSIELLTNLVCCLPHDMVSTSKRPALSPGEFWEIHSHLQNIANSRLLSVHWRALGTAGDPHRSPYQALLEFEEPFDRLTGYERPLRKLVTAIFQDFDLRSRGELGFSLQSALKIAENYLGVRRAQQEQIVDEPYDPSILESPLAELARVAQQSAAPVESAAQFMRLAEDVGEDREGGRCLLDALSTPLGSLTLEEVESYRQTESHPIIRDQNFNWAWQRPGDFLQGSIQWARETVGDNDRLKRHFDKCRQVVVERLVLEELSDFFGDAAVFGNVLYKSNGELCEADGLILLPGLVIVMEIKGGAFHERARRGNTARINTYIKSNIEKAALQNDRTVEAIMSNEAFTAKSRTVPIVDAQASLVRVIVTLDRVDPVSANWNAERVSRGGSPQYLINAIDLLALLEVADSPECLVAYILDRIDLSSRGVRVFVETDALGAWLDNRIRDLEVVTSHDGRSVQMVSNTSEKMNDYFTYMALLDHGESAESVGEFNSDINHGVHEDFIRALQSIRDSGDTSWLALTRAVFALPGSYWSSWRKARVAFSSPAAAKRCDRRLARKFASGYEYGGVVATVREMPSEIELELQVSPCDA